MFSRICNFVVPLLLALCINIHGNTTDSKFEITTEIVETTITNLIKNIEITNGSIDNSSNADVEIIEPSVKILNKPVEILESASRVVMPIKNNKTVNDFTYVSKNNLTSGAKHRVEKLDEELAKKILTKYFGKKSSFRPHARYDEVTGELIGGAHPCERECREGEEPMICYYHFNLEWYQTMSKACYKCPYNAADCLRPDCIPADGMNRALNVVNRKMPGPAIEVCQNDRIIVDVENDLMTEGTTVHWHGQHQRGTPYMDGTPYVTQCPILPETTFRYQFNATHAGTHFWHSHSGMQRADGAAGALVIRKPKTLDPHGVLYDYDKSDHVMIVTDWIHELAVGMFTDHHHSSGDNKPPTLLINGVGRFKVFNNDTEDPLYMSAARFNVEKGYKYRFRVINAEFLNCPIEMSVDGHNITIIASDGYDLEPITGLEKALMNIKATTGSENNPAIEKNLQETRFGYM